MAEVSTVEPSPSPLTAFRCNTGRRKQANPRRKNVEFEKKMSDEEGTDLMHFAQRDSPGPAMSPSIGHEVSKQHETDAADTDTEEEVVGNDAKPSPASSSALPGEAQLENTPTNGFAASEDESLEMEKIDSVRAISSPAGSSGIASPASSASQHLEECDALDSTFTIKQEEEVGINGHSQMNGVDLDEGLESPHSPHLHSAPQSPHRQPLACIPVETVLQEQSLAETPYMPGECFTGHQPHLDGKIPTSQATNAIDSPILDVSRCPHCGKLFRGARSSISLQEHITNIHAAVAPITKFPKASSPSTAGAPSYHSYGPFDDTLSLACTKCSIRFDNKDELDKHHLVMHATGAVQPSDDGQVLRKFKCPECFKAFKFKHHLKEHIRIHSGEKPFECSNCGKRFSHSGSYSSHMTSKKCLIVNLKVRKSDQIRAPRSGRGGQTNGNPLPNGILGLGNAPFDPEKHLTFFTNALESQKNIPFGSFSDANAYFSANGFPQNLFNPFLFQNFAASDLLSYLIGLPMDFKGFNKSFPLQSLPLPNGLANSEELEKHLKKGIVDNPDNPMRKFVQMIMAAQAASKFPDEINPAQQLLCTLQNDPNSFLNLAKMAHFDSNEKIEESRTNTEARKVENLVKNGHGPLETKGSETNGIGKASGELQVKLESDEESQRDSSSMDDEMLISDGKKVRVRSVLSEETLRVLRAQYAINPRPKKQEIHRLAEQVGYAPRVVQVWFQNMRARDRRLGRPIQSMTDPPNNASSLGTLGQSGLNYPQSEKQGLAAPATGGSGPLLSQSPHSGPCHTLVPPALSIPTFKPNPLAPVVSQFGSHTPFNNVSYSSPTSSLSPSRLALSKNEETTLASPLYLNSQKPLLTLPQSIFPKSDAPIQSKLFTNHLFDNSDSVPSTHDEPLDLSFKYKSLSDADADDSLESEVLNLSQKSSRASHEDLSEAIHPNISLALLQQQHDFDGANLRNVLLNNGKLVEEMALQLKNCESLPRSGRGRKRIYPDIDLNNSNDSNNNILKSDFESKSKNPRSSPSKDLKLSNGLLSSQSSPDHGEGLFTCDQCDKTFSKQSSLARHKYEHSGQRPHKCDVCSKAFKHKHHLTEHKRLHSGEKPFQCKKCLKRFSHSGSYSQHMNHRYSYCKPYRE